MSPTLDPVLLGVHPDVVTPPLSSLLRWPDLTGARVMWSLLVPGGELRTANNNTRCRELGVSLQTSDHIEKLSDEQKQALNGVD